MQGDYFGVTALHMAAIHPNIKSLSVILKCLKPGEIDFQDSTMVYDIEIFYFGLFLYIKYAFILIIFILAPHINLE